MTIYTEQQVQQALTLGSSTLFEASGLKDSALDHQIRPVWQGARVAGPAYPVACAPGDNLGIQLAVERAPKGSVLVVTTDNFVAGYWGEVLTVYAKARGLKGLIIDGGVRDIDALEAHQFPVFSRAISVRGTLKDSVFSIGEPIKITGTPVQAGDFVLADTDGVVVIPAAQASTVLDKSQTREDKERAMMKQLAEGATTIDLMGLQDMREKF